MVDAITQVILQKVLEILMQEGREIHHFHNEFQTTMKELDLLKSYMNDIDKVRIRDRPETLRIGVEQLRELLYHAEDVIADCEFFLKGDRIRRKTKYFSPAYMKSHYKIGKRLKKINTDIKSQRERMTAYLSTFPNKEHRRDSRPEIYPVLPNDEDMVGLDNDAQMIEEWILKPHWSLTVIAVVGMGGIGKTALAEKIRRRSNVIKSFDQVLMVVVSQHVDFTELIKAILRKLSVDKQLLKGDPNDLLETLQNKLRDEKHLLVLDDVWRVGQWWESLKSAFPQTIKNNGSCVLVTTRDEEVAQKMGASYIHKPKVLTEVESWKLFTKIAFARGNGSCSNSNLETIGRDVVSRCGGLPLAIKIVAGLMLGKGEYIDEWKRIQQGLRFQSCEPVIASLKVSYEELPMHLKPCLSSFGAFPEDSKIYLEDIIFWWIGEGFVQGRDGRTAYQMGKECFNELVSRCLLLGVDMDIFERSYMSCRVHDMVRDMILKIAKEEKFMSFGQSHGLASTTPPRRVNLTSNASTDFFSSTSSKMRTITGVEVHGSVVFDHDMGLKVSEMKWLRVLSISFKREDEQPPNDSFYDWLKGLQSVPHLVSLQIINSVLVELPDIFRNLHNLQILDLCGCRKLKRLPESVTSLEKLTSLNVFSCDALEYLPAGIAQLFNLQRLVGFKPASSAIKDGFRIPNLRNLTNLQDLFFEIRSEDQIEAGDLNVLPGLKKLNSLTMSMDDGISETTVDCKLAPLEQLQELHLKHYHGKTTPAWLNPACVPNLRFLSIIDGNITHLSHRFFGTRQGSKFSKLEVSCLADMRNLEELEWPSIQTAMPSLRLLKMRRCDKLKSFPSNMKPKFTKFGEEKTDKEVTGTSS